MRRPSASRPDPAQNLLIEREPDRDEFLEALLDRRDNGPERKLLKLVEFDEPQGRRHPQTMDTPGS